MLPLAPNKLGRYEIVDELGKGAMGVVYLARDPLIGRLVALKTFRIGYSVKDAELEQFRLRFIREAQSAGILSHPNIVTIHDVVERGEEGLAFIAMEYVRGTNLKTVLQEPQRPTLTYICDILAQVAEGLDYAHSCKVIHRDIKPANILITTDNRAKITDFGIARLDTSNLTQEGQLLGTPNYMSPEQILGRDVDHRADIFSLGVVLYEMVTRHKPFQGENLTVVSHRIVYDHFTPPREYADDLPPGTEQVLAKALEKEPARRYQRARDMADDLRRVLGYVGAREALNETQSLSTTAVMPAHLLRPLAAPPAAAAAAAATAGGAASSLAASAPAGGAAAPAAGPAVAPLPAPSPFAPPPRSAGRSLWRRLTRSTSPAGAPRQLAADAGRPGEAEAGLAGPAPAGGAVVGPWPAPTAEAAVAAAAAAARPAPHFAPPPPSAADAAATPLPGPAPAAYPHATRPIAVPADLAVAAAEAADGAGLAAPAPGPAPAPVPAAEATAAGVPPPPAAARPRAALRGALLARRPSPARLAMAIGAGLGLGLLLAGALALWARGAQPPPVQGDSAARSAAAQAARVQVLALMHDGRRRLDGGDADGAAAAFRAAEQLMPGRRGLRQVREEAERRQSDKRRRIDQERAIETKLDEGRLALADRHYDEAATAAAAVLAMSPGNTVAEDILGSVKEARARPRDRQGAAAARQPARAAAAAAPGVRPEAAPRGDQAASAPAPEAKDATLELAFFSQLPEGTLLVYVNGRKVLQEPFRFYEKTGLFRRSRAGTGWVRHSFSVKAGNAEIRVYVTPLGSAAVFRSLQGSFPGGSSRRLDVQLTGGGDVTTQLN